MEMLKEPLDQYDAIHASPPCFPKGTPVITARGVVAIETITAGDSVLTHKGRWRSVVSTMSREAEVVSGNWLATTADHPFWVRRDLVTDPEWRPAGEIKGLSAAIPCIADPLPIPALSGVEMGYPFWYMVGRWLGDGWVRVEEPSGEPRRPHGVSSALSRLCLQCGEPAARNRRWAHLWNAFCNRKCQSRYDRANRKKSRYVTLICCANDEAEGLESKLSDTGLNWLRSQERTTTRFQIASKVFALWITEHFGKYAYGKTLPGWLFGASEETRRAVLDGYLDADGSALGKRYNGGWSATTVSSSLAIGMRVLATTLGHSTSLHLHHPTREAVIEGRLVNERSSWQVRMTNDSRYSWADGQHRWVKQRSGLVPRGIEPVYDLTVEEDHSFVAWGFVVHNCQAYSDAMKHLTSGYPELIEPVLERFQQLDIPWVVENVPGSPLVTGDTLFDDHGALLCGSMFGLRVQRHRLFQTSFRVAPPRRCDHSEVVMNPHNSGARRKWRGILGEGVPIERTWREEMGVGWMDAHEGRESIPPVYTSWIGYFLRNGEFGVKGVT